MQFSFSGFIIKLYEKDGVSAQRLELRQLEILWKVFFKRLRKESTVTTTLLVLMEMFLFLSGSSFV